MLEDEILVVFHRAFVFPHLDIGRTLLFHRSMVSLEQFDAPLDERPYPIVFINTRLSWSGYGIRAL